MSLSPVMDEHYRLKPADVGLGAVRVTIQNVSLQGVEELNPVLHFVEFPRKRLVIDNIQCKELMQMTGSPLFTDWIGRQIDLKTVTHAGQTNLVINTPHPENGIWRQARRPAPARVHHQWWTSLGLAIVLIGIFGAVYALDNGDAVWQFVKHFLPR